MNKAKFLLGGWITLALIIAGLIYYFTAYKDLGSSKIYSKKNKDDQINIGDVGGWMRGFVDKNETLYPATEFIINVGVGDKTDEPFYAITLNGIGASEIAGIESKLASMNLLYVNNFDGMKYSLLILFEDKNVMMANFNELKKVYPFAQESTITNRSTKL